ncbi:M23 family metallopeptidase [Maridesulfovibrio bastinii]|uniref:M23 family metallopeptidase n=1 Tax=Maridesulfovibrio bastinii TaxID=47157 RepID=UPI00041F60AB|nr:M23 family metallopeptidase [Maridesulfovibrio bastinii]
MAKKKNRFVPLLLLIIILGIVGTGAYFLYKDTVPPEIAISPESGDINAETPISVTVNEKISDIKAVKVVLIQNDKKIQLTSEELRPGNKNWEKTYKIGKDKIKQGNFELAVWAVDTSLANFGGGNSFIAKGNYTLDTVAPKITIQTTTHNLTQGGCSLILYSLNETPDQTGVKVGDLFFKGYKQPDGMYASLFAIPFYIAPKDFNPVVIATDKAGNERTRSFYFHANPKIYRHDNIRISDRFLNRKMPQFEDNFPEKSSPLETFLKVNRTIRKINRERLKTIGLDTSPEFLFDGVFLRLPNAATRAGFGDQRSYIYNGKKIDFQTHLGIDLASIAHADVPAANNGKVVLAEDFGIYGNVIILDHGLGLQTLYAHLSQFKVKVGDTVKKGQIIAKTGATGMAGGDHLHFGVLCSGLPVNPLEWWDRNWIINNISSKLN